MMYMEDYIMLQMAPTPPAFPIVLPPLGWYPTREGLKDNFAPPPPGWASYVRINVVSIFDASALTDVQLAAIWAQKGEESYAVASLLIFLRVESVDLLPFLDYCPFHLLPLSQWDILKDFFTAVRRRGIAYPGQRDKEFSFSLRKIMSLRGRSDAEFDENPQKRQRAKCCPPREC